VHPQLNAVRRRLRSLACAALVEARLRSGNAGRRGLPDYLIIGAQRSGTTSLQKALARHPDVRVSLVKETHFFDLAYHRGETWYRAHFCLEAARERARREGRPLVMGEATPFYLAYPPAAERAASLVPDARLIVLLRNPVERAYSHYRHELRMGHEQAPMTDALVRELERHTAPGWLGESAGDIWTWQHRSYLQRGLYASQLATWMRWFPADQFLILRSEDYFAEPLGVLDQVCTFLGIRPASALAKPETLQMHRNAGGQGAPLPPELRCQLEDYYAEPNRALEALLGRTMGWSPAQG